MPGWVRCRNVDEGSVSLAVLVPSLLLLVFGTLNVAWWMHGRDIALAAARHGVATGRVQGSEPDAAARTASDFASRVGSGVLSSVSIDRTGTSTTEVCVRVSARVGLFIPFLPDPQVHQRACSPMERFTP
jgi:Flp pilus assembly protein TadG